MSLCEILTSMRIPSPYSLARQSSLRAIREDYPRLDSAFERNQVVSLDGGGLRTSWLPVMRRSYELAELAPARFVDRAAE